MHNHLFKAMLLVLIIAGLLAPVDPIADAAGDRAHSVRAKEQPLLAPTPVFKYPVVPDSTISGYFDHSTSSDIVTFYNGRTNQAGAGFDFQCSNPSMKDWVGCEDNVAGERSCANGRELWYDGHKGTDYEYSANWHTGAFCNPGKFTNVTRPVYAPARGRVVYAGYNPSRPGNGWHIRLEHDLNGNGNFSDDNFRSIYLHFTANGLAVQANDIVEQGNYLGLGGSTGYSSSPHLHFEIQKSNDNFVSSNWSVDPYGWTAPTADPWPHQSDLLFVYQTVTTPAVWLPMLYRGKSSCPNCGEMLDNTGFEAGSSKWGTQGLDIITNTSDPYLPVSPYGGVWLSWLGGRNGAADAVYQDFGVPGGLVGARLTYRVMITTNEPGGASDTFRVRLLTTAGEVVQDVEYLDNTFSPLGQWAQRSIDLPVLTGWQGQTLRLRFEASTNAAYVTSFYLDEISLQAIAP